MKKRNGFVLMETLVVVLLLTVTLMSLYASFSYIINKTKERNNGDSIETLYKTYYVKDILDSYQASDETNTVSYRDSFLYYINKMSGLNYTIYDYSGNKNNSLKNTSDEQLVICDYSNYSNDSDPLYEAISSYHIDKIYYFNYSNLIGADANKKKTLLNYFDASAIDYVLSQTDIDDYFIVVKYLKDYTYPSDYTISDDLKLSTEAFYSQIELGNVGTDGYSNVVEFCSNTGTSNCEESFESSSLLKDGQSYLLGSGDFQTTYGNVVVGWTNNKNYKTNNSDFTTCVSNTKNGTSTTDYCYKANDYMTVNESSRKMYAVWCGNGSSSTPNTVIKALQCGATAVSTSDNSSISRGGLYSRKNGDNTTYFYYGNNPSNFAVLKDTNTCYRIISNFNSTQGIKLIYYGTASTNSDDSKSCKKSSFYAMSAYSTNSYINSHAFSYNKTSSGGKLYKSDLSGKYDVCSQIEYSSGYKCYGTSTLEGANSSDAYSAWGTESRYLISTSNRNVMYYYITSAKNSDGSYNYVYYVLVDSDAASSVIENYGFSEYKYLNYLGGITGSTRSSAFEAIRPLASVLNNVFSGGKLPNNHNDNVYCNNMSLSNGSSSFGLTASSRYTSNSTDFLVYTTRRDVEENVPSLECSTENSENGYLGLLSVDEALYVGLNGDGTNQSNHYLVSSSGGYWTNSPYGVGEGYYISSKGIKHAASTDSYGIMPVVSVIMSSVNITSGSGTASHPFVFSNS